MAKHVYILLIWLIAFSLNAQITIIGHCQINGSPQNNVKINLTQQEKVVQSIDTKNKSTFTIRFNYGQVYKLYFQQALSPLMYVEIDASKVPENKYYYKMISEIDIPFFFKDDADIDTTKFSKPIQKIYFDGDSRMVSDTAYTTLFYKGLVRQKKEAEKSAASSVEIPSTIAAQILLNNNTDIPIKNQELELLTDKGAVIKKTSTDRFGNFVATGVLISQISKIKLISNSESINQLADLNIVSQTHSLNITARLKNNEAIWILSNDHKNKLIDNNYTSNIGGKLILNKKNSKAFFANKTVYLSNKRNTILKKTKTNELGAFAFDEIKPDQNYIIGVDASEIKPGEKIDLISKEDNFIASLDSTAGSRTSQIFNASNNTIFNALSISENEIRMNVNAKLYGDNESNPLGKIKIILLNDNYEVIDSTVTDDLGLFKFKYLPYLKRFFLSAENSNQQLDLFKNVIMYNSEENLIKVLTHIKGTKFVYKPISAEIKKMQDIEMEDPWLEIGNKPLNSKEVKLIVEPILFETNQALLLPAAIETLNKITLVLKANPKLEMEIGAHTDSKGNDAANMILSEKRAKVVYDYLIIKGIEKSRLKSKGYGENNLVNNCANTSDCSDLEHAINRRVEFKIISK